MKSLGAAVRTSNGRPPAARIASSSAGTIPSRWLKQIASFDEELTMAILGLVMSSSAMPSARHCARRTAQRELPSCRLLRSPPGAERHALTPATESCHGIISRLVSVTAA